VSGQAGGRDFSGLDLCLPDQVLCCYNMLRDVMYCYDVLRNVTNCLEILRNVTNCDKLLRTVTGYEMLVMKYLRNVYKTSRNVTVRSFTKCYEMLVTKLHEMLRTGSEQGAQRKLIGTQSEIDRKCKGNA